MKAPRLSFLMVASGASDADRLLASAGGMADVGVEVLVHLPIGCPGRLSASSGGVPVIEMRTEDPEGMAAERLVRAARGRVVALCRPRAGVREGRWAAALDRFEAKFPDGIAVLRPAGEGAVVMARHVFADHAAGLAGSDPVGILACAAAILGRVDDAPELQVDIPAPAGESVCPDAARRLAGALAGTPAVRAEMAARDLEGYEPPASADPSSPWPPRVACRGWSGRPAPNAIHYSRINTLAVMRDMIATGFTGGEVFLSRTMSGLPNILWAPLFERVTSVNPVYGAHPVVRDGKHTIHFGALHDDRFIYPVIDEVRDLSALVLDDRRYDELCCGYFLLKRILRRPGIIVFIHATGGSPEKGGMPRFLADLARGYLDNRRHEIRIVDDDPHGRGMAYEILS